MSYETFTVSIRTKTLAELESILDKGAQALEDNFADDDVLCEIRGLANEVRARLQRVAVGDLQS